MCKFISTSFRAGCVIRAVGKDTSGGSDIYNKVNDARRVGRCIVANATNYLNAIEADVSSTIKQFQAENADARFVRINGAEIQKMDDELLRARFDPGLIIDFSRVRILGEGCKFSIRSCLTVCLGKTQSKVWTRVVALNTANNLPLPDEDLGEFHQFAKDLANRINQSIERLYEADFSAALSKQVSLERQGNIYLFAADCEGPNISHAIETTFAALSWQSEESRKIDQIEVSDALRRITHIGMPPEGRDQSNDDAQFDLSKEAHFFPFRASNGVGSVFVSWSSDDSAYLTGIVDCGHSDVSLNDSGFYDYSCSTGTTAELATYVGSSY